MNMMKTISLIIVFTYITGCSLSPGIHMDTKSSWLDESKYVYVDSEKKMVKIYDISQTKEISIKNTYSYRIGYGDQISVTIWGLPEVFPINNLSSDQNLRRVDSKGNIFFPYAGLIEAKGKTQNELRDELTDRLSDYFTNPQVDVTIARFNSQRVFVLGEVTKPLKINITDIPISLSNAIGEAYGLNTKTASASEVFIIRQGEFGKDPLIFHADLKNPANFIDAGNFYLSNNDIVYVNSSGITRWNKIISQFFPFSTFLNSIDNLTSD